jgi:hypothetical protein
MSVIGDGATAYRTTASFWSWQRSGELRDAFKLESQRTSPRPYIGRSLEAGDRPLQRSTDAGSPAGGGGSPSHCRLTKTGPVVDSAVDGGDTNKRNPHNDAVNQAFDTQSPHEAGDGARTHDPQLGKPARRRMDKRIPHS